MSDVEGWIRAHMAMELEATLAEADMKFVLGSRAWWPVWLLQRLGYEIIFQHTPQTRFAVYVGIQRRGVWVVDRRSRLTPQEDSP